MKFIHPPIQENIFDKEVEVTLTVKELICIYLTVGNTSIGNISELLSRYLPNISNEDIGNVLGEDTTYHLWKNLNETILPCLGIETEED